MWRSLHYPVGEVRKIVRDVALRGSWAPGVHDHRVVLPWYHRERGLAGFSTHARVVEGKSKAGLGQLPPQFGVPALRGGVTMHFADQRPHHGEPLTLAQIGVDVVFAALDIYRQLVYVFIRIDQV